MGKQTKNKMKETIEIEAKLYNDILAYCKTNALNPVKYIEKALRERIATDKYGDLNQKIRKTEEPIRNDVTNEESHIVSQEPLTEEIQIQENHEVSKPNEISNGIDVLKEEKRKKRQLKTK